MRRTWRNVLAGSLLITVGFGCGGLREQELQTALEAHLEAEAPSYAYAEELQRFYAARAYQPLWTGVRGPGEAADTLLARLCTTGRDGLDPADYNLDGLARALQENGREARQDDARAAQELAALDLMLSEAFLRYADHLAHGRITPSEVNDTWYLQADTTDLTAVLQQAAEGGPAGALDDLVGRLEGYIPLREALDRYRALQQAGGWRPIPGEGTMEKGAAGERVVALRRRLAATGDLEGDTTSATFDEALEAAVRRFQQRHGLEADGVVGPDVLTQLNVPVEQRIRQITLNLERRRWLPARYGDEYVFVNIPDYHLYVVRGGETLLEMPVIVGKRMNQTPVFADTMEYVVFNPFWNVPAGIAIDEILPEMQEDPRYLARNDYEVVGRNGRVVGAGGISEEELERETLRIRQRPGPQNALGQVKFMFPNDHDIYLHDTPSDHLFSQADRGFSHGCVRVAGPVDLAEYVLRPNGDWPREKIEQTMQEGTQEETVHLARPLPVYLVYLTAWVDRSGALHFRDDLYGQDAALARALFRNTSGGAGPTCRSVQEMLNERD